MIDKDIEETRKVKQKMNDVAEAVGELQNLFAKTSVETAVGAMLSYLGQLMYAADIPISVVIKSLNSAFDFYDEAHNGDDT